jgi:HEAT repeat protein
MTQSRLADISNPKTRLSEFELRLREGSDTQVRRTLLEAMADSYPPLRHQAALASADRDDEAFDEALRSLVVGEPEGAVAQAGELGVEPSAIPTPDAPFREAACLALRTSHNPRTVSALLHAGTDDSPDVRYQALVSLHELDASGDAFGELVASRLDDEDPEVVVVAAQITAQHGWTQNTAKLLAQWRELGGTDKLQIALSLSELHTQHGAEVPGEVLDAITDELIEALEEEETIAAASQALVQLRSERAVDALENVVKRWFAHPILKVEAAGALHELGKASGTAYLEKSLNSSRKDARGYALRLVGRLRISEYFDELDRVARSDDYHADTAVLALADYGGQQARAVLEDVVQKHSDSEVRELAAKALQKSDAI